MDEIKMSVDKKSKHILSGLIVCITNGVSYVMLTDKQKTIMIIPD